MGGIILQELWMSVCAVGWGDGGVVLDVDWLELMET